jgi:hypothetical protein
MEVGKMQSETRKANSLARRRLGACWTGKRGMNIRRRRYESTRIQTFHRSGDSFGRFGVRFDRAGALVDDGQVLMEINDDN